MYIVEVRSKGDGVAAPMADMRTWFDNQHVQPTLFQLSIIRGGTMFRLEFESVSEAEAFARAFGGRVISHGHIAPETADEHIAAK